MSEIETPLAPMEKESSDDMVNIQIEESLVRETLMGIDSANFNEDLITLFLFGFVLIFVISSGIFGPPVIIHKKYPQLFSRDSPIFNTKISFDQILPINNQNSISISFLRNAITNETTFPITFSYSVVCYKGLSQHFVAGFPAKKHYVKQLPDSNQTSSITLFTDSVLDYNKVEIELTFDHAYTYYSSFIITYSVGAPEHTVFQIYFRIFFAALAFIFLALILYFLRKLDIKLWHLEQKLTIPLNLLLIFYNNPFYVFHAYSPSPVFIILDRILDSVFHAYLSFFILVLFDSLRYKNRKTDRCFFIPKIIMCFIMLIIYSVHGIYDKLHLIAEHNTEENATASILTFAEMAVYLAFVCYTLVSIIISAAKVDVTERYKFNIYLASGLIAIIIMGVCSVLINLNIFAESSLSFVIRFAVENVFTLLMTYFHWPYEVLQDQYQNDPQADFFVNEQ